MSSPSDTPAPDLGADIPSSLFRQVSAPEPAPVRTNGQVLLSKLGEVYRPIAARIWKGRGVMRDRMLRR